MIAKAALDRGIKAIFAGSEFALLNAGVEVTDPGYQRQPAVWDSPGDGSLVNAGNVYFPPFRVAVTTAVDGWAIYDGAELLATGTLNPSWPRPGDVIELSAGGIRLELR